MTDSAIPVRRGEPFKALLIVLVFWIVGRFIWQGIVPSTPVHIAPIIDQFEMVMRDDLMKRPAISPQKNFVADFSAVAPLRSIRSRSGRARWSTGLATAASEIPAKQLYQKVVPQLALVAGTKEHLGSVEPLKTNRSPPAPLLRPSAPRPVNATASISSGFSGYFWLFARQGNGSERSRSPASQFSNAQYGASQAGAILSYRIAGEDRRNISTFVRASTALSTKGEEELAIGIKTKPLKAIPVSFFAEQRFGKGKNNNRGTALYLAGGTGPDLVLPDITLETYGQAGFVFARDDSHFFDASAVLQKQVIERGGNRVTAGAGFWASGQKGATRFDVGPRVKFHVPVGPANMQVSVDWRERIAGNANPGSGASVTVSTGF
ncbi:hypothetical protein [Parasphingorhabdus cellanae]|uniref:Bacterial surface antigen (D15) domain-containing protein n=1 Tax=Parasphingorhabdus cellanae TaxID=2806553 RepID=A0ABX7T5I3_9SPHN|nr:hypothetical protein [Parasphingorhabdus cellanae]QTD55772.1 hypothetical protein J4G78_16525 [Parasphingorhabdus cellanae]